jgi:hypothetical protein
MSDECRTTYELPYSEEEIRVVREARERMARALTDPEGRDPVAERDALWKECKRVWRILGQIEKKAHEVRKGLPGEHPLRLDLLTLETLAKMGLTKPRNAMAPFMAWLEAEEASLATEAPASPPAPQKPTKGA